MNVDKNSFHYKYLYRKSFSAYPPTTTNLCTYFWRCAFMAGLVALVVNFGLWTLWMCVTTLFGPILAGLALMGWGAFTAGRAAIEVYSKREKTFKPRQPSLLLEYLRAKKARVCPLITFET